MKTGVPKKEKNQRVPAVKRCDHVEKRGKAEYLQCDTLTATKGKTADGRLVYCCPSHAYLYREPV